MRPSDVDALLRSLLPALSIAVAGCTSTGTGKSSSEARVEPRAAESAPSDEVAEDGGEGSKEATPDLGAAPERLPKMDRPRATCPTVTWCAPQAASVVVAADGARDESGCPTQVTSEQGLTPPKKGEKPKNLMDDPVYSRLLTRSRVGPVALDPMETQKSREAGQADACCYSWTRPCPGGRPFLDAESIPMVARMRSGDAWKGRHFDLEGDTRARAEAAEQWLEDAAMEHASVASFARTTLELMALGAPAGLLERTHRAALDEVEHAQTCLAIARACGAAPLEPGPMRVEGPREADFARLAVDTFIEGCVGETTGALAMQRAAAGCKSPGLRAALLQIADDEAQHAALAWETLAWAQARGGARVRAALKRSAANIVESLEAAERTPAPEHPRATQMAKLGRLSPRALQQTRRDAWFGIIETMLAQV